jgi:hypothetical protein
MLDVKTLSRRQYNAADTEYLMNVTFGAQGLEISAHARVQKLGSYEGMRVDKGSAGTTVTASFSEGDVVMRQTGDPAYRILELDHVSVRHGEDGFDLPAPVAQVAAVNELPILRVESGNKSSKRYVAELARIDHFEKGGTINLVPNEELIIEDLDRKFLR